MVVKKENQLEKQESIRDVLIKDVLIKDAPTEENNTHHIKTVGVKGYTYAIFASNSLIVLISSDCCCIITLASFAI